MPLKRWLLLLILSVAAFPVTALECGVFATNSDFGSYDHADPLPTDTTGTMQFACVDGGLLGTTVIYNVSFSTGVSGTYANREMAYSTYALLYNLYTDAARVLVWGDGTGGTSTVSGVLEVPACLLGLGCTQVNAFRTIYGRVPAGQAVGAGGPYTDNILITVDF